jgi:hypothetical protein
VAGAEFFLHTFQFGSADAPYQTSTPCGLELLRFAGIPGSTATRFLQSDVCGLGSDPALCSVTITPPSTTFTTQIALGAACANAPNPTTPTPASTPGSTQLPDFSSSLGGGGGGGAPPPAPFPLSSYSTSTTVCCVFCNLGSIIKL